MAMLRPDNSFEQVPCTILDEGVQLHINVGPGTTITFSIAAENIFQMAMALKAKQLENLQNQKVFNDVKRGKR